MIFVAFSSSSDRLRNNTSFNYNLSKSYNLIQLQYNQWHLLFPCHTPPVNSSKSLIILGYDPERFTHLKHDKQAIIQFTIELIQINQIKNPSSRPSSLVNRLNQSINQSINQSTNQPILLSIMSWATEDADVRKHFELVSVPVVVKTMVSVRRGLWRCFGLHLDLN